MLALEPVLVAVVVLMTTLETLIDVEVEVFLETVDEEASWGAVDEVEGGT